MGTGLRSWYVIRRVTADFLIGTAGFDSAFAQKWNESWLYVDFRNCKKGLLHTYTPDQNLATPFKTKEAAEAKAFSLTVGNAELIHNLQVVLR